MTRLRSSISSRRVHCVRATAEILLRLAVLYKRTGNEELAAEANSALTAVRSQANNVKE